MVENKPLNRSILWSRPVFALSVFYSIPVLLPSLFGWMTGILAVPVAYICSRQEGSGQNSAVIPAALLPAGILAFFSGRLPVFVSLLPLAALGYSLFQSGQRKQGPARAAACGLAVTVGCLALYWLLYAQVSGTNPYHHLKTMIDAAIVSAGDMYRTSVDAPADMRAELDGILANMRVVIPQILPALLISILLVTVWMNQVLWNGLLLKTDPDRAPWPPYSTWKLPEQLVWLPICAAACYIFGPGPWKIIALNALIISGVVYFFQGLAVLLHLLDRLRVPGYFRIILYGILVIQSYGLILLSLLGIGDIWFNLRTETESRDSQ